MALPSNSTPIDDQGDLNPTTVVMNFLKSKGFPLNGASIRTALEENARNPGYIPDLRNNRPSSEAEDQAAMAAAGKGGGGRSASSGGALPTPPMPPMGGQPQTTSAPPGPAISVAPQTGVPQLGGSDIGSMQGDIPGGIGALIASGLGLWGASKFAGGGAPQMSAVPGGMPAPTPVPNPGMQTMGAPAEGWPPGGPFQSAMNKAMQGPQPVQPPMVSGVPPVAPGAVSGMQTGPSTADPAMVNEAAIASGQRPPPRVPIRPRAPGGLGEFGALLGRLKVP